MKKFAIIFSAVALIFAFSTATVSAQNSPEKAKTEKVSDSKVEKSADAKAGCADKAKAGCTTGDKAKAGCATPCGSEKAAATPGCCAGKASAKAVPAPQPK